MTFWGAVIVAYAMILMVGIPLGVAMAHRWPGGGRDSWDVPDEWTPQPDGGLVRERENA